MTPSCSARSHLLPHPTQPEPAKAGPQPALRLRSTSTFEGDLYSRVSSTAMHCRGGDLLLRLEPSVLGPVLDFAASLPAADATGPESKEASTAPVSTRLSLGQVTILLAVPAPSSSPVPRRTARALITPPKQLLSSGKQPAPGSARKAAARVEAQQASASASALSHSVV